MLQFKPWRNVPKDADPDQTALFTQAYLSEYLG